VFHFGTCAGGNNDCKPNTTEDCNKATIHDNKSRRIVIIEVCIDINMLNAVYV